jgi:DNA-binding transcriptional LysR family regulator
MSCEFSGFADQVFAERSVGGPTVYKSERDDWVLAMVAAGLGYAFLPQSLARFPGTVARPAVEPEFWRTVNLVTVRGRPYSPAVGAFVREVMSSRWGGKEAMAVTDTRARAGEKA